MSSSPAARSDATRRRPWRGLLLWGSLVGVLLAGLVFAARFGGSVPTLLETVAR